MLSKNKIKYLRSLKLKKFRQMYNNFMVEGDKMARELLSSPTIKVESVFAVETWLAEHGHLLGSQPVNVITEKELQQISNLKTPNQVFVVAKQAKLAFQPEKLRDDLALYLDGIQDPGNMGTILRIADWFGIPRVFCGPGSADWYNPKVIQSTMGAFLRVEVMEKSLEDLVAAWPEMPVYGTVLAGEDVFTVHPKSAGIIVIGSEGKGIRPETEQRLTHRISIPRAPQGGAESLNAGIATGIICAVFRNRVPGL